MPKATAVAYAIQGLVKYHGLKDKRRRIPFHDSISVCAEALTTKATVEFDQDYSQDIIEINGKPATELEATRVLAVVSHIRSIAKSKKHFKLLSINSLTEGKGLGFSAAAFAAISLASSKAVGLELTLEGLSEIARLGAGSASRSVVGGFSIWYAQRDGRSYARQLASGEDLSLAMVIVPIPSQVKTDRAHEESESSAFFQARLREVKGRLREMLSAIRRQDVDAIGRLAEADTRSLHAVTMTGKSGLILMAPEALHVIERVLTLREREHVPVWYSLDTGPSVYLNTRSEFVDVICRDIEANVGVSVLKSGVAGPAHMVEEHLF